MDTIETLVDLGQKQRVRLTLDDGSTVEGRVNQSVSDPHENLRLELSPDGTDEYQRYQVRSEVVDGDWNPPEVRGHETGSESWTALGTVEGVTPLETFQTLESDDMEAQDETGTDE